MNIGPMAQPANGQRWEMKRRLIVAWYAICGWFFAPGWITRAILTLSSFALILVPIAKLGWKWSFWYTIWWAGTGLWKAWRELSPKHMQVLQRNYIARKLRLFKVIEKMRTMIRRKPSVEELNAYQEEVLSLIVSYVRDHRRDLAGAEIFANLILEIGDSMAVVARDTWHRRSSGRMPREHSVAFEVLKTGEHKVVGDLYREYPQTPPGKPYRSILAIPVFLGSKTVGVVSIDSSRAYRFDGDAKNLVSYLVPYVALLAWTIEAIHTSRIKR